MLMLYLQERDGGDEGVWHTSKEQAAVVAKHNVT